MLVLFPPTADRYIEGMDKIKGVLSLKTIYTYLGYLISCVPALGLFYFANIPNLCVGILSIAAYSVLVVPFLATLGYGGVITLPLSAIVYGINLRIIYKNHQVPKSLIGLRLILSLISTGIGAYLFMKSLEFAYHQSGIEHYNW